jgi:hypothetical protein
MRFMYWQRVKQALIKKLLHSKWNYMSEDYEISVFI